MVLPTGIDLDSEKSVLFYLNNFHSQKVERRGRRTWFPRAAVSFPERAPDTAQLEGETLIK
jgi:hypothetical protein